MQCNGITMGDRSKQTCS